MRTLMYTFLIFLFISCSGKGKIPGNIIKPGKMELVLKDLFIVDAVNAERGNKDTTLKVKDENRAYFERVLFLHKVSHEQFEQSYAYYLKHPDLLKEIADSLMADVNRASTKIYSDTSNIKLNGRNFKDSARKNRDR